MSIQVPDEHKMTRSQAEAWLEALRSGKHQQAAGSLCTIDPVDQTRSYCCLGIRALVEGATFRQGAGEVEVFAPGTDDKIGKINDSDMLVSMWAEPRGLAYDVQTLLARLNDGNTAWIEADHEMVEVYKATAARSTATDANDAPLAQHRVPGFTCEFEKHDFGMIADVIEKYFIR